MAHFPVDPSFTFPNYCNFVFFVTNREKLNFEHWRQKWFNHFAQIVNNSKIFLKTSHTHSLSFYFLIFQIATRHMKRAYLFKNKNLKKTKAWFYYVILPYPILLGKKNCSSACIFPMEPFSKKWLKYAHTPNRKI